MLILNNHHKKLHILNEVAGDNMWEFKLEICYKCPAPHLSSLWAWALVCMRLTDLQRHKWCKVTTKRNTTTSQRWRTNTEKQNNFMERKQQTTGTQTAHTQKKICPNNLQTGHIEIHNYFTETQNKHKETLKYHKEKDSYVTQTQNKYKVTKKGKKNTIKETQTDTTGTQTHKRCKVTTRRNRMSSQRWKTKTKPQTDAAEIQRSPQNPGGLCASVTRDQKPLMSHKQTSRVRARLHRESSVPVAWWEMRQDRAASLHSCPSLRCCRTASSAEETT